MQKHIKVYIEYFWENPPCEICWEKAVDIHHIEPRSHFWKKTKHLQDDITNLIWLCRLHHQCSHFQIEPYLKKEYLKEKHINNLWKIWLY